MNRFVNVVALVNSVSGFLTRGGYSSGCAKEFQGSDGGFTDGTRLLGPCSAGATALPHMIH